MYKFKHVLKVNLKIIKVKFLIVYMIWFSYLILNSIKMSRHKVGVP